MIINKPKDEMILREATAISVDILRELGEHTKAGITTLQLDELAGKLCKEYGVKPSFKGVNGYKYNSCISVNDVAVHGIPNDRLLEKGDLVSIDFGVEYKGLVTDHCWTWSIGNPSEKDQKLMIAGKEAVENAMGKAVVGSYTGDLGCEMESTAKKYGFNVFKMFVGHGIGRSLHEYPEIPAFGKIGSGDLLVDGMVICIECQVVDGSGSVTVDNDDWTARTKEGGSAVMYEYMVIVRKNSPTILTDTRSWGVTTG